MKKIIPISVLLILGILQTGYSTNYQFYGYTNDVYSVSTNWSSSGYPGATILSGDYARFTSNWSMGRCSLDVDVTNNGHMLFDSKFYYNGHLVTNNSFIEAVGIIYGDVTNNGASGIFSPGWNLLNFSKNASINGSFESSSTVRIDFYGSDYYGNTSHDAITTSTATISGTLDMHFITGFIPVIGQDYILINSTNLTGNFTNIIWPAGAAGTVTVNGSDDIVVNFSSALPVELEHFNVHIEDHIAKLDWSTATEENNLGFEIQKSTDANNWSTIGFVNGRGTSSERQEYTFTDDAPHHGDNYYRLKQLDYDGRYEFSEIRQVRFSKNAKELLNVFPNPAYEVFSVGVTNPNKDRASIKLFSSTGQMLWQKSFKAGEMEAYWKKEFSLQQEEMYFVQLQVGDAVESKKIIVIDKR